MKIFTLFGVKILKQNSKMNKCNSLWLYAVTHNKPAFAIETSKNIIDLAHKVTYQLKSIEEFMKIMDIEFERDFDINNYKEVEKRLLWFWKSYYQW